MKRKRYTGLWTVAETAEVVREKVMMLCSSKENKGEIPLPHE